MSWFSVSGRHALVATSVIVLFLSPASPARAAEDPAPDASWNRSKNLARLNVGAHIDRILPGGRIDSVSISSDANENAAALCTGR